MAKMSVAKISYFPWPKSGKLRFDGQNVRSQNIRGQNIRLPYIHIPEMVTQHTATEIYRCSIFEQEVLWLRAIKRLE